MIVTRTENLNGRTFVVSESDSGHMIERDGALYSEAWDLEGSGRTYTETNMKAFDFDAEQDISAEKALDIILGGGGV